LQRDVAKLHVFDPARNADKENNGRIEESNRALYLYRGGLIPCSDLSNRNSQFTPRVLEKAYVVNWAARMRYFLCFY